MISPDTPPPAEPEIPPVATDHIEQSAAKLAQSKGHTETTDEDRREVLEQARKTAPPAQSSPPTPEEGVTS